MEPPRKVLIIDDSPYVLGSLASLAARIARVEVAGLAEDGERGLELFAKLKPDVVLLDLELPGMGGIEVLKRIRQQGSSCVVIVMTSYAFAPLRERCLSLGADYFLDKAAEFLVAIRLLGQEDIQQNSLSCPRLGQPIAVGEPQR